MHHVQIRPANKADSEILARHRCEMFAEMGILPVERYQELFAASLEYFRTAVPAGDYCAWLAESEAEAVAGAGMQVMHFAPRPGWEGNIVQGGRTGRILNVYVEKPWRRRGIARDLVREAIAHAKQQGFASMSLEASDAGRAVYESLGFHPVPEMRMFL